MSILISPALMWYGPHLKFHELFCERATPQHQITHPVDPAAMSTVELLACTGLDGVLWP
jgi:hypothetical protein